MVTNMYQRYDDLKTHTPNDLRKTLATSSYQKRKTIYSIPSCNLKLPALSFTPRFLVLHDDNDVEATNNLIN
jgi:hypothetical protein